MLENKQKVGVREGTHVDSFFSFLISARFQMRYANYGPKNWTFEGPDYVLVF